MLALCLAPLYLLANGYLLWRLLRWLGDVYGKLKKPLIRGCMTVFYGFTALSMVINFLLKPGNLRRHLKVLENYWLGVLLYSLMAVGAADAVRLVCLAFGKREKICTRKNHVLTGGTCAAIVTSLCLFGAFNARKIRTKEYQVAIPKKVKNMDSLKIVLIADLHLGYNIGCAMMKKMAEKINQEKPDLVVIAGDIFDNQYEALKDPKQLSEILKGIKSPLGVYACYGNHDIQEAILGGFTFGEADEKKVSHPKMDAFLERSNIRLLQDEGVLIKDVFYLYGRPDAERPGRGIKNRKTPAEITGEMDLEKPVIVLDHQPKELLELSQAGADLVLGGHTHGGQVFPGNLVVDRMWENSYGYLKKGTMHSIVTSGVGLFGPYMRVGTPAEICSITVKFGENE